ncbi:ABC transporter substrate-binding protein [Methylobacterium pseudosasicola]|uniref:Dipeptide transport system substrate-binding protein n=1 Tax=Methylobacterium pseudosasicola TaxID=582667 RepID=A0A1I4Q3R3_9HYPH|nr:ABC transporter substrate-binding protein [Methylobacterium pseudosasicola]SFM34702.1 dipeptide transport system substrate-binding protein [Methylobacterium pseudosasicola]
MSAARRYCAALVAGLLVAADPAAARTFVFCSEGSPESFDPARATTTTTMNVAWQVYDTLVEFAPGTTTIRPALAESWTVSEDGRTYLFALRDGVRFHHNARFIPSRTLNAEDVVFSFTRQLSPGQPLGGTQEFTYFHDLGLAELIEAIDAPDSRHIRFRLREADTTFLANIAQAFGAILSAEYAAALTAAGAADDLARQPIGTGPFAFESYRPDQVLRYRAFSEHWRRVNEPAGPGERPDGLVFAITPNAAVRLTKLRAGECHAMAFPATGDLDAIRADPELTLLALAELNVAYLALNTTRPPFDDVRVRRAVNLAIDRQAIVAGVYGAAGILAQGPVPPGLWAFDPDLPAVPFDRAEAQRLLAEAGLADGFDTELWYPPVSRPYNPDGRRVADMIRADLAQVGIRAELVTRPWNAYRAALYGGMPSLMLYGWTSDNGDPDNFLNVLLGCKAAQPGGANLARWCDPVYERLVEAARRTGDRAQRQQLYRRAQGLVRAAMPWVPLAHTQVHLALRGEVFGFTMDPLGRHLFETVRFRPLPP